MSNTLTKIEPILFYKLSTTWKVSGSFVFWNSLNLKTEIATKNGIFPSRLHKSKCVSTIIWRRGAVYDFFDNNSPMFEIMHFRWSAAHKSRPLDANEFSYSNNAKITS